MAYRVEYHVLIGVEGIVACLGEVGGYAEVDVLGCHLDELVGAGGTEYVHIVLAVGIVHQCI